MKVRAVSINNRKAQVELTTRAGKTYPFPFSQLDPKPTAENCIQDIYVDKELANEGATYTLESGDEGSVLLDHALAYNREIPHMSPICSSTN
jgi:hypothetical protein